MDGFQRAQNIRERFYTIYFSGFINLGLNLSICEPNPGYNARAI